MFKEGDWVHTQDGIGIVTKVFPHYYQYWQKAADDRYREETYGDNEKLATSLLGERKEVGEWVKDIIYIKRLCDHDAVPKKRIMCFHTMAYANDKITQKEMAAVNRALKDRELAKRFDQYRCKYRQPVRAWNLLIPADQAVRIGKELARLENNAAGRLTMTMREIEAYFREEFRVDIYEGLHGKAFPNATLLTRMRSEGDDNYYNKEREEIVCSIRLCRKRYDEEQLAKLIQTHNLEAGYYDRDTWMKAGWDETER